jgi:hypothetical protein
MAYEREADFATGQVRGVSFELRPDAVVSLAAPAPGPAALGDVESGLLVKGWYVRPDNDTGVVYLGESDGSAWLAETPLFAFTGAAVDMLSLAFDQAGLPVVAMERAGEVWVRYHDGESYVLTNLGTGASPALVHRAPDTTLWGEIVLFYERALDVYFRIGSEDYATERNTAHTLDADQKLWRAILGPDDRLHLILSRRDAGAGTYTLQRVSSDPGPCLDATGYEERIDDGAETLLVFRDTVGEIRTNCLISVDAALIGAAGNAGGGAGRGQDTKLFVSLGGLGLDPDTDTPPDEHIALGGGHGAIIDQDGQPGGSGGAGGGKSPSGNTMWSAGGLGSAPQGHDGGGAQSTWGLLDKKLAASGGGGGFAGAGTGGVCLQGWPLKAGRGGPGGLVPGWRFYGPRGGHGYAQQVNAPTTETVDVHGGGAAGGVRVITALVIPAGQTIAIQVGQGIAGGGAGQGGDAIGGSGRTGAVVIRITRLYLDDLPPAVLSGGVESVYDGYRYHRFTATDVVTVTTPGRATIKGCGGGAGGGSGRGGGGGGADVREVETYLYQDETVTVGDGGAGGTAGSAGEDGEDSSVGDHVLMKGGGAGAGAPPSAAGSRATGGGGHGDGGVPGAGSALRGYQGGDGGGFSLSAGGDAEHAGGGGGAGESGDRGATLETMGDELAENWEVPSTGTLMIPEQQFKLTETGGSFHALIETDVAVDKMFVQALVKSAHSNLNVGPITRATHPTGDPDEVPVGYHGAIHYGTQRFVGIAYLHDLASWHHIQAYVQDGLSQYAAYGESGSPRTMQVGVRKAYADTALDGTFASFGFAARGTPISGTNKQAFCDHLAYFRDKNLLVEGVPTGGSVEVLNEAGDVVASGAEAAGIALVDLSMFGTGVSGVEEPMPMPEGFHTIRVLDSGSAVVAERSSGGVYPGGEYDVVAGELVVRIDETGPEPVPITGLMFFTDFSELTPGPLHGDGGDGIAIDDAGWLDAGMGDAEGYLGGGGGGGAEQSIAGAGGKGGGGAGSIGAAAPTAGAPNTGGGGGGSGDAATPGAAGGSGDIVIRTLIP